ncbi:MAG: AMP-binding protein [Verrucomicrobiales bacterium]
MAEVGLDPGHASFWESDESLVLTNPRDPAVAAARAAMLECDWCALGAPGLPSAGLVGFLTSGTTGHPKVIGFTRHALLASARAVNDALGVKPDSVWLRVLPRFHVGGFQVESRAWAARATLVTTDGAWDPVAFDPLCRSHGVTHVSLVPTQVFDLVQNERRAPPSLQVVLVGGGELHPALAARARTLGWPVRASYGLTEAASTVAVQDPTETDVRSLTLLPHWQADVAPDGRLLLNGPALPAALAVWNSEANRYHCLPFMPPLRTSDRVHLQGNILRFLERADRVVKRLGELIDLAQLERALAGAAIEAGAFGRVCLRGEPDARSGHRLVLECLDAAEGATVAARFNSNQPPFARIEEIRPVPSLRLTPLGKPSG